MKKNKLVSVVVQAYNSADTITRTLESVKAQDYQNIELIVTDDKSADHTIEVVTAWIEENQERFLQDTACHNGGEYRDSRKQQPGTAACDRRVC